MIIAGKLVTLAFWGFVVAALMGTMGKANTILVYAGGLVLAAHVLESLLMYTVLKEKARPRPVDILLVLLFGAFHLKPKLQSVDPD